MGNKITLTYENGEFNVAINESVVYTDKEMEGALLKFNSVVKNNAIEQNNSWDSIEAEVNSYNIEQVEVNSQFKTVNFGKMKYFYNTDKVFYIQNNSMISLGGGYSLFNFVLKKINEQIADNGLLLNNISPPSIIFPSLNSLTTSGISVLIGQFALHLAFLHNKHLSASNNNSFIYISSF